jgi:phosphopantetheinyl transferase (holo-ACP synthase)
LLVGNDIVDLYDPWSQPDSIHRRFDSRAFTPTERARILASRSAHQLRWSLWAAKESAFKVARKLDGGVRFLPREFTVRMLNDGRAEVSHPIGRFGVWFERAEEWLHAVAVLMMSRTDADPSEVSARIGRIEEEGDSSRGGDRPSVRVREVAQAALGALMGVSAAEIEIVTHQGIPAPHRRDERLPVDLSLSHHGRFVACAWAVDGPRSG